MNDRIRLPVVRLVINSQPFEQFFFPLEYSLEGGYGQRLSEAARPGKKISCGSWTDHVPDVFGLIHIQELPSNEFLERIGVAGQVFHDSPLLVHQFNILHQEKNSNGNFLNRLCLSQSFACSPAIPEIFRGIAFLLLLF